MNVNLLEITLCTNVKPCLLYSVENAMWNSQYIKKILFYLWKKFIIHILMNNWS